MEPQHPPDYIAPDTPSPTHNLATPQDAEESPTDETLPGFAGEASGSLPLVSVVVLNYNGLRHLETCFTSLMSLDYPRDRLELMLVDNGSSDASLEFMRGRFPTVRIVETGSNLGFAAGNNYGAERAAGEYVAFLNNDTRVEPDWLSELVLSLKAGEPGGVVCTSSLMLDWSGKKIDFQAGALNFHGFGFQPSYGLPVAGRDLSPRELLFACGGSMLIRKDVFLDVGGFDGDYFAFFEDVDLGWRLWVLGYRITLTPSAVTYHRHHGTAENIEHHRIQVLYERNALFTIYKNYEQSNLDVILPSALLLAGQRMVRFMELGGVDLADYDLANAAPSPRDTDNVHRNAVATLLAVNEFTDALDKLKAKREKIQSARKLPDAELFARFEQPGRVHLINHATDAPYAAPHFTLLNELGIEDLWSDLPKEVLVISPDVLPVGDIPATGSGIRAWSLGKGLESRGHRVRFTMPAAALQGREDAVPEEYLKGAWTPESLQAIVDSLAPDVVVSCGWPNLTWLPRANLPVALDLTGPHLLERAYQEYRDVPTNAEEKIAAIQRADFYTCISERQRYYFTGWLAQAGVDVASIPDSLAVIPYSVEPELPEHHWPGDWSSDDVHFVYGGIFLPWQNPAPALLAVASELEAQQSGVLSIIGGKHPFHAVHTGGFSALVEQMSQMPRVRMSGLLPHDELVRRYTRAHVAVDVMMPNAERELAFPSRTVHYFWCGLPVIHAAFSEVAAFIRRYEAGWVVRHDDPDEIRHVVRRILADPSEARRRGENAARLARELFTWDKTVGALDRFVRNPYMRPERARPVLKERAESAAAVYSAGTRSVSGVLLPSPAASDRLPRELVKLAASRRAAPAQFAARSGALLRELVPRAAIRQRKSPAKTPGLYALPELVAGRSHGQRFYCAQDGLSGIQVRVSTLGRKNTGRLVFHLRTQPAAGGDLFTLELPSHQLKDGATVAFRFHAVERSANRWFYLMAESPDGVPGDAPTLLAMKRCMEHGFQRYEDGLPASGCIAMTLEFGGEA